jgi:hypothetical protein
VTVALVPRSAQLVDAQGRMTAEWWRFVQELYQWSGLAGTQFPLYDGASMVPAMLMLADAVAPPGLATVSGAIQARAFDAAASERLHFACHVPWGYGPGTELVPSVRWAPTTTNAGVAAWVLDYTLASLGDAFVAPSSAALPGTAGATALEHLSVLGAAIDGAGVRPGAIVQCSIYRNGGDGADTYPDDALLLSAGFVLQNAAHGSQSQEP